MWILYLLMFFWLLICFSWGLTTALEHTIDSIDKNVASYFKYVAQKHKCISTIKDLFVYILYIPVIIFCFVFFILIKCVYNKHTIAFMNVKIKKSSD